MYTNGKSKSSESEESAMADGQEKIKEMCRGEEEVLGRALRIWYRDFPRTTPGLAVYSAKRVIEMEEERFGKRGRESR